MDNSGYETNLQIQTETPDSKPKALGVSILLTRRGQRFVKLFVSSLAMSFHGQSQPLLALLSSTFYPKLNLRYPVPRLSYYLVATNINTFDWEIKTHTPPPIQFFIVKQIFLTLISHNLNLTSFRSESSFSTREIDRFIHSFTKKF